MQYKITKIGEACESHPGGIHAKYKHTKSDQSAYLRSYTHSDFAQYRMFAKS